MMGMRARDSTTWEAMRPPSGSRAPLSARSCIVKRRILPHLKVLSIVSVSSHGPAS